MHSLDNLNIRYRFVQDKSRFCVRRVKNIRFRVLQIQKICPLKLHLVQMLNLSFVVSSMVIDLIWYRCIYLGASDGRIHCWNAETGSRVCTLVSDSMSGQTIVSMNPKFMLLVSASNQLVSFISFLNVNVCFMPYFYVD